MRYVLAGVGVGFVLTGGWAGPAIVAALTGRTPHPGHGHNRVRA